MKKRIRSITKSTPGLPISFTLFVLPIILSVIGLIFVFESSSIRALSETGDSFHYLKLQGFRIVFGIIGMFILSYFNYKNLYIISFPFLAFVVLTLLLVLIPGIGTLVNGTRGWINLGFFNMQPTEFAKVALILYLSSWFSQKGKNHFVPFMLLLGLIIMLIMIQPDLGAATIIFSLSITIYYLAGQNLRYLLLLFPVSVVGFVLLIFAAPYRLRRLTAFLNPTEDPQGVGYHINQILISLSNGGLFGQGFGASRQKYLFLPEAHTDSIFAIYGEELGFIGSVILIGAFVFFLYKLLKIYESTSDRFAQLLIGGILAFFGLQLLINLGGMVGLMPLTGVPLPFISYGGSHILISFALVGIAVNIAKSTRV
ncbi:MAG TPA: putative peptidoglycan glycosyltransferase FtsW [Candidatus Woesebacteria bacterium]|nr:putative peptidoglycan glycosyltransferase FtsW [Candidatus Woesebacteria bacterium]